MTAVRHNSEKRATKSPVLNGASTSASRIFRRTGSANARQTRSSFWDCVFMSLFMSLTGDMSRVRCQSERVSVKGEAEFGNRYTFGAVRIRVYLAQTPQLIGVQSSTRETVNPDCRRFLHEVEFRWH